jgi:hypothetical protein
MQASRLPTLRFVSASSSMSCPIRKKSNEGKETVWFFPTGAHSHRLVCVHCLTRKAQWLCMLEVGSQQGAYTRVRSFFRRLTLRVPACEGAARRAGAGRAEPPACHGQRGGSTGWDRKKASPDQSRLLSGMASFRRWDRSERAWSISLLGHLSGLALYLVAVGYHDRSLIRDHRP